MAVRLARGRIHYAWLVACVTFLVLFVTAGVRSIPTVLIVPLEREFGWRPPVASREVAAGFAESLRPPVLALP